MESADKKNDRLKIECNNRKVAIKNLEDDLRLLKDGIEKNSSKNERTMSELEYKILRLEGEKSRLGREVDEKSNEILECNTKLDIKRNRINELNAKFKEILILLRYSLGDFQYLDDKKSIDIMIDFIKDIVGELVKTFSEYKNQNLSLKKDNEILKINLKKSQMLVQDKENALHEKKIQKLKKMKN